MAACSVAKTMIHRWEEPPISGTNGSGAVFFAGCNLRCVFCQNYEISQQGSWQEVTAQQLAELFWALQGQGVHNINLVTPSLYVPMIAKPIKMAKNDGFNLPFVYNSSAYESISTLQLLDGLIDVYLPDLKYFSNELAQRYSNARRYFEIATRAILEMWRQAGECQFDEDGIVQRGLIIRHLVLPGSRADSMKILDWIAENVPQAHISLMAQYVPTHRAAEFPELNRRVTTFEYRSVVEHAITLGLEKGYTQSREAATGAYIPDFTPSSHDLSREEGQGNAVS